ncbi:MAG: hypothetical protein U5M50_02170 [Sphingobium sp.]|nr:hypothetical protein [Sphingobium sp.]
MAQRRSPQCDVPGCTNSRKGRQRLCPSCYGRLGRKAEGRRIRDAIINTKAFGHHKLHRDWCAAAAQALAPEPASTAPKPWMLSE